MDVPVVAAMGLEGDIHHTSTHVSKITLSGEIFAIRIGFAFRPSGVQGLECLQGRCHALSFYEYLFHRFGIEGNHVGQVQAFHHVERTLLVLLEMG